MVGPICIAQNERHSVYVQPSMANRHGCITGATGTGKTVSLQVLAEGFSRIGTPVFVADAKGDLSGISQAGSLNPKLQKRLESLGLSKPQFESNSVEFWDVFGQQGHPVRVTISDLGPMLLSRMLDLNDTQEGIVNILFRLAKDEDHLILDLKDLRAMLQHISERASELRVKYGNISAASVGAIQRSLLRLENEGDEAFFGEPALDIFDWLRTDAKGHGLVNVLAADKLLQSPRLYAVFLLWMLSELYQRLPEVGDMDKPKFVFFFDEAHLLFNGAPKALVENVEQIVRLIRSKGVGVYFITQNPNDIPDVILGQLGHRIQHALRAFTVRDQKAVRAAAQTMRSNPELNIQTVITELGVGEALVSMLDHQGSPTITERVWISAPGSRIGMITETERQAILQASLLAGKYTITLETESAYERLGKQNQLKTETNQLNTDAQENVISDFLFGTTGPRGGKRQGLIQSVLKTEARRGATRLVRMIFSLFTKRR